MHLWSSFKLSLSLSVCCTVRSAACCLGACWLKWLTDGFNGSPCACYPHVDLSPLIPWEPFTAMLYNLPLFIHRIECVWMHTLEWRVTQAAMSVVCLDEDVCLSRCQDVCESTQVEMMKLGFSVLLLSICWPQTVLVTIVYSTPNQACQSSGMPWFWQNDFLSIAAVRVQHPHWLNSNLQVFKKRNFNGNNNYPWNHMII